MGWHLPVALGAFSGLTGGDLLEEAEQQLRPHYGTGLYGGEGSAHQRYRRGQVWGLAWAIASALAVRQAAWPDKTVEFLDEWESLFGVWGPQKLTVEERQIRLRARVREIRGTDATSIEDALIAVAGGDYFVITTPYPAAAPLSYLVQIYNPITPTDGIGLACLDTLWRMTPAHVQCYVEYPDLGIAVAKLGA